MTKPRSGAAGGSAHARGEKTQRICFVVASPLTAQAFLTDQVGALSEIYDVHLVMNADPASIVDPNLRKATMHRARIERPIAPWTDLRALFQLLGILRRGRYAAVHSVTPKAGLLAMLAAFATRVPVRVHTFTGQVWATRTGADRLALKTMDRLMAAAATHVLVDSPSQRDFLKREGVLPAERGEVLAQGSISGVDTARFRPDAAARTRTRSELDIPGDATLFVFVGRLSVDKGVLDLARAFATAARTDPAAYLLLVGPDEDALEARIREAAAAASSRLRFVGMTGAPERYLAAGDVFCLPSYREGFGSSIIEAAAAGLPAIASRIYGIVDAIEDGATGVLIAPADVTGLADAMARLARDEAARRSMGGAARERALRDFSQENLTSALVAFYERVLPEPPSHERKPARANFD